MEASLDRGDFGTYQRYISLRSLFQLFAPNHNDHTMLQYLTLFVRIFELNCILTSTLI